MQKALASFVAGLLFYVVFVWRQPRADRVSIETWSDCLGIGLVASMALFGLLGWVALGLGPDASGNSIVERLFATTRWRYLWMPYAGFGAVAFTICAAVHVLFLKFIVRQQ